MGRQIRPAQVFKTVTNEMNHRVFKHHVMREPPWYQVVGSIPPAEISVRTIPPRHRSPNKKATKPRNIYRPQEITYPEDRLRETFYKDHPWELARPRVILELDGKDAQRCDWSKGVRQPGIALSGECVVQRQLYLIEEQNMPTRKAYDQARREFYRLRQLEEVERRIAVEEARYVGAYFGKTRTDVGLQLEDAEYEKWKVWAEKETADREARAQAGVETFNSEEEETDNSAGRMDDYAESMEGSADPPPQPVSYTPAP